MINLLAWELWAPSDLFACDCVHLSQWPLVCNTWEQIKNMQKPPPTSHPPITWTCNLHVYTTQDRVMLHNQQLSENNCTITQMGMAIWAYGHLCNLSKGILLNIKYQPGKKANRHLGVENVENWDHHRSYPPPPSSHPRG